MATLLISGFEPFNHDPINPSWQIAQALDGLCLGEHQVVSIQLPVVFGLAEQLLFAAIEQQQPQWVLCLGYAAQSQHILLERLAINLDDAPIADNAGQQPREQSIAIGAENAYFTGLPIAKIHQQLTQHGFQAQISNSAGSFVCNHVYYQLLHAIAQQQLPILAGFIHLPATPEMLPKHGQGLDLATQIAALHCVINHLLLAPD